MFKINQVPDECSSGTSIQQFQSYRENSLFWIKNRYVYMLLLATYSYFNILFTEGVRIFGFELNGIYLFGILSSIVMMVWEGNGLVTKWLNNSSHQTKRKKIHPLITQFLLSLMPVGIAAVLPILLLMFAISPDFEGFNFHLKLSLGFAFRINLFLNSINAIVYFMSKLKKSQIEAEKFKKESMEAQFEALKNQINPHFLFNSFNVLSNLVYKDPDTSSEFIQQLSKVYRYLLKNQEQKLVKVKVEVEFLKSYIYLLSIRFDENLLIKNNLPRDISELYIAPASLQLLIENAIKHNIVSNKKPLIIEIYNENYDYLAVKNNLQTKPAHESSTSVGLKNITRRYKFISDLDVVVEKTQDHFLVKIPLIEIEKD